ncbi:MAG: hypothetical protein ACQEQ7_01815 [Thermodesulfobacteriota bacterium]
MKPKKRTPKKDPTPSVTLSEQEKQLVTALLDAINHSDPAEIAAGIPDVRCARVFLGLIPLDHSSTPHLLSHIKTRFEDKQVHKAIKKVLFKLKKKGVAVEDPYEENDQTPPLLRPSEPEPPRCYVGALDGKGYRPVVILLNPGTGQHIGLGVISDEQGIQEFLFGSVSKKRAKELKQQFSEESGPLVETTAFHLASVLEQAYQKSLVQGVEVPADYLELRSWLQERARPLQRPIIYDHVEETSFLRVPLTDGQMETLLNQPLMKAWLIELEPLRPFMKEIMESGDSPLILSPGQKTQRITEIKNRCAVQLFPREKRQLIKGRLEEMAYMFYQLDKETECTGLCLRAAASMDEEVSEIRPNRFLAGLVDRSMAFYFDQSRDAVEAEEEENNHASSSILIP